MRTRSTLALLVAVSVFGCSSQQSTGGALPAPTGAEVLTHTFSNRGEFVRVFLASGITYEAELNGGGIQLQVRPIDLSVQPPRVEERVPGSSAGGSSIFTIQPRGDGEYEFRAVGGDPGSPLTLRLRVKPSSP